MLAELIVASEVQSSYVVPSELSLRWIWYPFTVLFDPLVDAPHESVTFDPDETVVSRARLDGVEHFVYVFAVTDT